MLLDSQLLTDGQSDAFGVYLYFLLVMVSYKQDKYIHSHCH